MSTTELKTRLFASCEEAEAAAEASRLRISKRMVSGLLVYGPASGGDPLCRTRHNDEEGRFDHYNRRCPWMLLVPYYQHNLLRCLGGTVATEEEEQFVDALNREASAQLFGIGSAPRDLFAADDFVYAALEFNTLLVADYLRVITDPIVLRAIYMESAERHSGRILNGSDFLCSDVYGPQLVPVYIEAPGASRGGPRHVPLQPGLPFSLESVHWNHRESLLRYLLWPSPELAGGEAVLCGDAAAAVLDLLDEPGLSLKHLSRRQSFLRDCHRLPALSEDLTAQGFPPGPEPAGPNQEPASLSGNLRARAGQHPGPTTGRPPGPGVAASSLSADAAKDTVTGPVLLGMARAPHATAREGLERESRDGGVCGGLGGVGAGPGAGRGLSRPHVEHGPLADAHHHHHEHPDPFAGARPVEIQRCLDCDLPVNRCHCRGRGT